MRKPKQKYFANLRCLLTAAISFTLIETGAQVCSDPSNVIYGFTNTGQIRPITVSTGTAGAAINPAYSNPQPNYANATGYNPLNGKFYFFKRNPFVNEVFMSFDPATNTYQELNDSPAGSSAIINLGCVTANGLYYYCLDAMGVLYCYSIAANTWTTICSNIRNQASTTLSSIIDVNGSSPRYYGDLAMDGFGNMWMLISGANDYGLYKINAPLPTTTVANLTANQILPPTTPAPMGSFGGIAFNATGQVLMSSNSPDNRLFRMNDNYTLTFISNLSVDGVGNDLTSCNFPMFVLASQEYNFSVSVKNNNAFLSWTTASQFSNNKYLVEYSDDGNDWTMLQAIPENATDSYRSYSYTHSNLTHGSHYYRLRITDVNGTISYSTIKKAEIIHGESISIWPNPATHELVVEQTTEHAGNQLFLHEITGRLIKIIPLKTGINKIDVTQLAAGTYLASIRTANGNITNKQFIKQ